MRYTIPPELERRAVPRTRSFWHRVDRERFLLAAVGATSALLGWFAIAALTGVGKSPSLTLPLAVVMAVLGGVLATTRLAPLVWTAVLLAAAAFVIVAATPFATGVLHPRSLIRDDPLPHQRLDAVIVLSGGITPDSLLMPEALDRLLAGLALMRDSVADTLVVTEPRRSDNAATTAPDQRWVRGLVSRSFPMLMVDSVRTTHDEATRSWQLLGARGATRVAVVTSPLHTSRACATFEAVGFTVVCIPAASRTFSATRPGDWKERVELFREWLYERAATIEYRMRGWLRDGRSR
jgi:uncharacterized SAM-binding protein YcdF (DUF218 family)